MRALALDTTTRAGSVALVEDDVVVEERSGDASRTHGERLPDELVAVAAAHRLAVSSMDIFAVASGPGSFTGLRIGIATIQGLAFVTGRHAVGVSALKALGFLAADDVAAGGIVAAWMDAHRRDVFAALYRVTDPVASAIDRVEEIDPAMVASPADMLDRWRRTLGVDIAAFVGDGASLYADEIARVFPNAYVRPVPALAGAVGRIALARARRGESVDPAGLQPLYVRRPDAEIARELKSRQ